MSKALSLYKKYQNKSSLLLFQNGKYNDIKGIYYSQRKRDNFDALLSYDFIDTFLITGHRNGYVCEGKCENKVFHNESRKNNKIPFIKYSLNNEIILKNYIIENSFFHTKGQSHYLRKNYLLSIGLIPLNVEDGGDILSGGIADGMMLVKNEHLQFF